MASKLINVKLLNSANVETSKEDVKLRSNERFYTSSRYLTKGKYYYEFTHLRGKNFHVVGYTMEGGSILSVYQQNKVPSTLIYYTQEISSPEFGNYENLKMSTVHETQTVGLGIDLDSNTFYIRSEEQSRLVVFSTGETKGKKWRAYMTEATDITTVFEDHISINFGEKPFKYQIPLGFTPLNRVRNYRCQSFVEKCFFKKLNSAIFLFTFSIADY